MAERKRRYFEVIDGDGDKGAPPPPGPMPLRVGDILRNRREELGYDLPALAKGLRIRLPYLEAIEQCRYADLPGQAYVTGFLRTYALALGLDAGPLLRRYKEETADVPQTAELYFPEPVNENRVPAGAVILLSLVLAAVIYAGWYMSSASERSMADLVPSVPERLTRLIMGEPAPPPAPAPAGVLTPGDAEKLVGQSQPTGPEVGAPSSEPAVVAQGAQAGPQPSPVPSSATVAAAPGAAVPSAPAPATAATPPGNSAAAVQAPPVAPTPAPPAAGPQTQVAAAPPAPAPTQAPAKPVAATAAKPGAATAPVQAPAAEEDDAEVPPIPDVTGRGNSGQPGEAGAGAPTVAAPALPDPAAAGAAGPGRVFGQTEGPVRVVVRAVEQTWIEVRDGKGTLWASRVLRPGDEFRAPDVPGLTMVTGNAGGLSVVLDGRPLKPLGEKTQVMRDVSLVPADLAKR